MVIIQTLSTFYLTHSIPDSHEFSFERRQKVLSEKKRKVSFMGTNISVTEISLSRTKEKKVKIL